MYRIKKAAQKMGKKALIAIMAVFIAGTVNAQVQKVAVFDPAGNVDNVIREIIREEISSIIVNTSDYTVLERQLINKVLEESKFQTGGMVDDAQISEIGKMMGANYVFVSSASPLENNNFYLSFKMIDVTTARIEKQKTASTSKSGTAELINVIQKTVKEMIGEIKKSPENVTKTKQSSQQVETSVSSITEKLTADGRRVYHGGDKLSGGIKLSDFEVRDLMMNNKDALRLYNKSILENRNGNICLFSGVGCTTVGLLIMVIEPFFFRGFPYDENLIVGGIIVIAGAGIATPGVMLKLKSKKHIRDAVDMYNRGGKLSNKEFQFNFR